MFRNLIGCSEAPNVVIDQSTSLAYLLQEEGQVKRLLILVGSCVAFLVSSSVSQSIRPFKDLAFSQVAAGGGYETSITVANRGIETYNGSLSFYRAKAEPWNPVVDGNPIANGKMVLSLPAGTTRTLIVTGDGSTQSGFAIFIADSISQSSFLEGNLTYFVKSGATITDSVGVTPSTEFYLSTIPFEDFLTVALALVYRGPAAQATVKLTIFSRTNETVATKTISIGQNEQWVKFLWEELGRLSVGRGRLEIQSDTAIMGTALMFLGGQFSSLPLLPTMRSYNMVTVVQGVTCKGRLSLWAEGSYFKGHLLVAEINGSPAPTLEVLVFGQLYQSKLKLLFYAPPTVFGTPEAVGFTTGDTPFSFDLSSMENSYIVGTLKNNKGSFGTGTFTLSHIK